MDIFKLLFWWVCFLFSGNVTFALSQKVVTAVRGDETVNAAKRYFRTVREIDDPGDLTWCSLLLRRIHFLHIPSRRVYPAFFEMMSSRLKVALLRAFFLSCEKGVLLKTQWQVIFSMETSDVIYTRGAHVCELYETHFPDFRIQNCFRIRRATVFRQLAKHTPARLRDHSVGLTVFTLGRDFTFIEAYRLMHPNRRIVLRFHDRLKFFNNRECTCYAKDLARLLTSGVIDEAESYDPLDAEMLGIRYRPNGVSFEVMKGYRKNFRRSLVTFFGSKGSVGHDRLREWRPLQAEIKQFYPQAHRWIRCLLLKVPEQHMPYNTYLDLVSEAEVQLDFYRVDPDEGYSFRILEALLLGQKVITNRQGILKEFYYSADRFFVVGYDPLSRLQSFLEAPVAPLSESDLQTFDTRGWWKY